MIHDATPIRVRVPRYRAEPPALLFMVLGWAVATLALLIGG